MVAGFDRYCREVIERAPEFRLLEERETPRGWRYRLEWTCGGATTAHEVSLSWVDHNYWCGGAQAPSATAEQVLGALIEAIGRGKVCTSCRSILEGVLPGRFDLSIVRRIVPDLDTGLRRVG